MDALVLAVTAENEDAILDGKRRFDHRRLAPKRLPDELYSAGYQDRVKLVAPQ